MSRQVQIAAAVRRRETWRSERLEKSRRDDQIRFHIFLGVEVVADVGRKRHLVSKDGEGASSRTRNGFDVVTSRTASPT